MVKAILRETFTPKYVTLIALFGILAFLGITRTAYGDPGSVLETLALSPFQFLCAMLVTPILGFINSVVVPLGKVMLDWGTDFTTIPLINQWILWLQAFAVIAVLVVRIGVGIKDGIFLNGGNREKSLGEYIFKSIIALIVVAIMPTLCRLVILLGNNLFTDFKQGSTLSDQLDFFKIDENTFTALNTGVMPDAALWLVLGVLALTILVIAVGYQIIKRQIEMLVISLIAPLVAIYQATEYDSDEAISILKDLFGLVCIQWIQIALAQIALAFGTSWLGIVAGQSDLDPYTAQGAVMFVACLATFGVALSVPDIVMRYTAPSSGSRVGGTLLAVGAGAAARSVMRAPGAAARGVRSVSSGTKAASGTVAKTTNVVRTVRK